MLVHNSHYSLNLWNQAMSSNYDLEMSKYPNSVTPLVKSKEIFYIYQIWKMLGPYEFTSPSLTIRHIASCYKSCVNNCGLIMMKMLEL